jgi:AbiV family abortive infection protein
MTTMSAVTARELWQALVRNAADLVVDASRLGATSPGRARSLLVLALEELGKALWVYEAFAEAWTKGDNDHIEVVPLTKNARDHLAKFMMAQDFGHERPFAWYEWDELVPVPLAERTSPDGTVSDVRTMPPGYREVVAARANLAKQHGFYVDLDADGSVVTPGDASDFDVALYLDDVATAIQEMAYEDHYRKIDAGKWPGNFADEVVARIGRFVAPINVSGGDREARREDGEPPGHV